MNNATEALLNATKKLIDEESISRRKRGEDFNIFSIMRMERNETKTHSAMLVALLRPDGLHYQGTKFLKLFLETIEYKYEKEDLSKVKVLAEYYLGAIDDDYERGGFIDMLITFPSGKTIAIENKIDADDQLKQLYRYSKYNLDKSQLYYLTLQGLQPSADSLNELKIDNVKIISYKEHIIQWLENCLHVVDLEDKTNTEMLHQSLKQYILIVKQITNQMSNELQPKLLELISSDFDSATTIANNLEASKAHIRSNFRDALIQRFKDLDYRIIPDEKSLDKRNSIEIEISETYESRLIFEIFNFNALNDDDNGGFLSYGIRSLNSEKFILDTNKFEGFLSSGDWLLYNWLKIHDGSNLNLLDNTILTRLANTEGMNELVEYILNNSIEFINQLKSTLKA